jgi:tetratricopeptide (TPR) repeat protein
MPRAPSPLSAVLWLLALLLPLAPPRVSRAQAAPAQTQAQAISPYDEEVAARAARFQKEVARRSPAAVVPLLGLHDLWDLVADRDALAAFIKQAAAPTVPPDVRAHGLFLLRALAGHRGDQATLDRTEKELGLLRAFSALGPFDNEGGKGHDTAFPPETDLGPGPSPGARYEGKSRAAPPTWRKVPPAAITRDGRVLLDNMMRPDSFVTAYAVCFLKNTGPALPVAVRAGSSGPLKIWLNRGAPVLNNPHHRPFHPDQDHGAAVLLPGWNRLLVKLSANEGHFSFLLRLTTPDGRPLPASVTQHAEADDAPPRPAAQAKIAPSNLERALREAARTAPKPKGPARAQALWDLGLYLHHVGPGDPEAREDEALLQQVTELVKTPAAHRAHALVSRNADDRRRTLEAGRDLGAGFPARERARLLLALGRVYEEVHREHLAEAAYAQAHALDPALYTAAIHRAQLHASRGLHAEAARVLAEIPDPAGVQGGKGTPLRLLRERAALLHRRERGPEAEAAYAALLTQQADDLEALRHLLDRRKARGQLAEALALLDRIVALRPELGASWTARERVELLEGAGRTAEALAALDRMLEVLPADAELLKLRGRLLLRLSRDEEARSALRRSLALRPQDPELRAYLAHLDPQARSGEDLARSYRLEVDPLRKAPLAKAEDPARVLLDQTVVRVHDNGLSESFTQRVIEILDERGAREYGELEIRYTPETQSAEIKAARVHKKDGEVQEIAAQGERNVSEPWYGLYYDVRAQTLRFDGLRPGDVINVEYVISDVGRRNLLSDYFGDLHFLQEEIPRAYTRYVLLLPADAGRERPIYFNTPRGDGVKLSKEERLLPGGRERLISFSARDVPRIDAEPGMPGYTEVVAYVHASTYKTWQEVARWYTGLIKEQLQPNAEMTRAARAAVAGITDERKRVAAIYNLVVKRTRYVGLEFGIHGYKPYKVTQVFNRKFGDCKDKAALLMVLLREAGIESTMVLARTRRNGDLDPTPASLSAFDHAIVYVPRFDLYLDGTAEFSGSAELPAEDQDIPVLIVSDPRPPHNGAGHLTRTPVLPAAHNEVKREMQVQLHKDGGARVKDEITVNGQTAQKWREHYQAQGAQRERYEKSWNDLFPGAKAVKVAVPDVDDLERAVTLRGEVDVPAWGRPGARDGGKEGGQGDLVLRPLGREPDLLTSYARLSQRRHDLVLGFPFRNVERVTVRLPQGLRVRHTPEGKEVRSPFGRFELRVSRGGSGPGSGHDGEEITVSAELQVDRHRITKADYPAFRRFCAEVDSLVAQELVVGP